MKLSKLYCNKPFKNIEFNLDNLLIEVSDDDAIVDVKGQLNVVLADIRTKTETRNTHSLGKSKLIDLIDFLLLRKVSKNHWLLSVKDEGGNALFSDYEFYLELLLASGRFLTIKRSVDEHSKVSFKIQETKSDGFRQFEIWDHERVSLDKARQRLAEYLDFDFFRDKEYDFRKSLGYCLRNQNDYKDVFTLDKFTGPHKYWKPFIFDLLGFHGNLLLEKYSLQEEIESKKNIIRENEKDFDIRSNERDKLVGQIQIKKRDKVRVENELNKLNFFRQDTQVIEFADQIEQNISRLNSELYRLEYDIRKLSQSIEEKTYFDIETVRKIHEEVRIYFPNELTKSFHDLEEFNKKITEERNALLRQTLLEKQKERSAITTQLIDLNGEKEKYAALIQDNSSFSKLKRYHGELSKLENDLGRLEGKLDALESIDRRNEELKILKSNYEEVVIEIEKITKTTLDNERYTAIRNTFADLVGQILGATGLISIELNSNKNVDFDSDIVGAGNAKTAEDEGFTYRKILCMAFDLAILINYRNESYYRFVYHDDAFANEDNRVKKRLLHVLRNICEQYDLQYIFSAIKDELPREDDGKILEFAEDEIVLRLHDKDDTGKLFLMSF